MPQSDQDIGGVVSPGGFVFGVQGWNWGEPKPQSITFFLDNTARVSDQHGRPIRGAIMDSREILFAKAPPNDNDRPAERAKLATHAQIIAALTAEHIDWQRLSIAGWPQLPYAELKKLTNAPQTPLEELRKIPNKELRKDALRWRRELDEMHTKDEQEDE